jgi:hypothetical protein
VIEDASYASSSEKWPGLVHFWDGRTLRKDSLDDVSADAPHKAGLSYRRCEPDITLEFDNATVIIEVKLDSGLSNANEDNPESNNDESIKKDIKESGNQLVREAELLRQTSGDKHKILILLAPAHSAYEIYTYITEDDILGDDIIFGYLTWESVYEKLLELESHDSLRQTIIKDLIDLLRHQGFETFNGFSKELPEISEHYWHFDNVIEPTFDFIADQQVKEEYYVFG